MDSDATWAQDEFGDADLGDVRRTARLVQLASVLGAQPSASLPAATDDPASLKAAYRFFANDYVRAEAMLASHVQSTKRRLQAVEVVLAVQDTTYLDWTDHPHTTDWGRWPRPPIKACWPTPRWRSRQNACRSVCFNSRSGRATRTFDASRITSSALPVTKKARNG